MRYKLYDQGLTKQAFFDNGVLADKTATTEIFRNMEGLIFCFVIKLKFWIF